MFKKVVLLVAFALCVAWIPSSQAARINDSFYSEDGETLGPAPIVHVQLRGDQPGPSLPPPPIPPDIPVKPAAVGGPGVHGPVAIGSGGATGMDGAVVPLLSGRAGGGPAVSVEQQTRRGVRRLIRRLG